MSDNRIKVIGYAQRQFFNGGIEYRNFSDDLVGNQQTDRSDGSSSNLTLGNFVTTTNFEGKSDRVYDTKKYSNFITLESLDLTVDSSTTLLNNNVNVSINLDKSNLSNFAYFGSATEFVRVSLENIITLWPASLYIKPSRLVNGRTINGFTVLDYTYDITTNKSTFSLDTNFIVNKFDINYQKNGTIADTFNEGNDIRNLTANFSSYVILFNDTEYPVIGFEGSDTKLDDFIKFEVEGNPFGAVTGTNQTLTYHIKPKKLLEEEFFNSLNSFEDNLLNRLVVPKYTSEYNYMVESDEGILINRNQKLTWPVSDGYNIDFSTNEYVEFVTNLLDISNAKDSNESNLITRFLTSESISDFDTIPTCDGGIEETSGQKMNKTLKIYGREFDEIKKYIDGISFANVVTYDKKNNMPDQLVKNLAKVLGWELVSSVLNEGLVSSYLTPKTTQFSGQSRGLTAQEADVEMWRRLILNSAWIWKSKGTRKAVEFFFKFIGAPDGLINFNEYVYSVKSPIDMDLFMAVLENNDLDTDLSLYNVDADGYPKFFKDTSDMYFQKGGQWYRQTGGDEATQHILAGNNPHVGPYDNGREYIEQLNNIIPSFTPFTLTSTTTSSTDEQLFGNYNEGMFNQYNGDIYVDVVNEEGVDFSDVVLLDTSVIEDPCPTAEETDCGCDIAENDESLKIKITNNVDCDNTLTVYNNNRTINKLKYFDYLDIYKIYYDFSSPDGVTTAISSSPFVPKEICRTTNDGVSFYHRVYDTCEECLNCINCVNGRIAQGDSEQGALNNCKSTFCKGFESIPSPFVKDRYDEGYLCGKSGGIENDVKKGGIGCTLSSQWVLRGNNAYDSTKLVNINGEDVRIFVFIDPIGNERLVNISDSCYCSHVYYSSTPVLYNDKERGEVGYACIPPSGIYTNRTFYNNFYNAYRRVAYTGDGDKI